MTMSEETKSTFFCVGAVSLALLGLLIGLIAGSFADVNYYEVSSRDLVIFGFWSCSYGDVVDLWLWVKLRSELLILLLVCNVFRLSRSL